MARYIDPVCKRCRREGRKLYLKATRCYSQKCPMVRESPPCGRPPGMHGARKTKLSEYGQRLREKQKLKFFYGLLEAQFRRVYGLATKAENTGEELLSLLERRLDNVVHRLGFMPSRRSARQLVSHGHVLVNGRRATIPSMVLRPGDTLKVRDHADSLKIVRGFGSDKPIENIPDFLERIPGEIPEGRVTRVPASGDIDPRISEIVNVQLIIELTAR